MESNTTPTTSEVFLRAATAIDRVEGYPNSHAVRMARIADALAEGLGMAPRDRQSLHAAALMHDVGELVMRRDYLQRSGSLTEEERLDLSRHPVFGELEAARLGADRATRLLVRWHHESWNGGGYPDGLRREEIPLAARILRLTDVYAALTDDRPFRNAWSADQTQQYLTHMAGIDFDPRIVTAFLLLDSLPELESFARTGSAKVRNETGSRCFPLS
jgi:HD-GYP domain-containing protein (c-di-GMP phosphodiesterase class II)